VFSSRVLKPEASVARLLVSVRSAEEALAAADAGADIIDVKEPTRGSLGRADEAVWRAVREVVPRAVPMSVALGELSEWAGEGSSGPELTNATFWKLGLAKCGSSWQSDWRRIRDRWRAGPGWVAVAYADWELSGSPDPERVLDEAIGLEECVGILVDTWDKSQPSSVDLSWSSWYERARNAGLTTALAGKLDRESISRLAPLRPDIVAVRGAACFDGERSGGIDPERVRELVRASKDV
jgi:(5-formylfuran-3-yl)methyl phosphate synthase